MFDSSANAQLASCIDITTKAGKFIAVSRVKLLSSGQNRHTNQGVLHMYKPSKYCKIWAYNFEYFSKLQIMRSEIWIDYRLWLTALVCIRHPVTTAAGLLQKCTDLSAVGFDRAPITFSPQKKKKKLHRSSFESKPRPALQGDLGTLVWPALGVHPSVTAALTPAQTMGGKRTRLEIRSS